MRLNKICAAFAACGLAFGMSAASGQKLSDDKIVIGFVTDMSSLYSDIDGPGGVEAIAILIASTPPGPSISEYSDDMSVTNPITILSSESFCALAADMPKARPHAAKAAHILLSLITSPCV